MLPQVTKAEAEDRVLAANDEAKNFVTVICRPRCIVACNFLPSLTHAHTERETHTFFFFSVILLYLNQVLLSPSILIFTDVFRFIWGKGDTNVLPKLVEAVKLIHFFRASEHTHTHTHTHSLSLSLSLSQTLYI